MKPSQTTTVVVYGRHMLSGPHRGTTIESAISFRNEGEARACHRDLIGRIGVPTTDPFTYQRYRIAYARVMVANDTTDSYVRRLLNQAE
jgi:hypothetical protein